MQNQYTISTVRDCTLSVMYCDVTNMVAMVTMDTETMTSGKISGIFLNKTHLRRVGKYGGGVYGMSI